MPNNETNSVRLQSTNVRFARETRERAHIGGITYVVDSVAYRASIGSDGKIERKAIFAFPSNV
jgi:hypothetical protein